MKKLIILTISIILSTAMHVYCQTNALVLKNKTTGKENVVREGQFVKVWSKNGAIVSGKLKLMVSSYVAFNSEILVGSAKININDIKAINVRTGGNGGGVLLGLGAGINVLGIVIMSSAGGGAMVVQPIMTALLGLGVFGIGIGVIVAGIVIMTDGNYYQCTKWDISVNPVDIANPQLIKNKKQDTN